MLSSNFFICGLVATSLLTGCAMQSNSMNVAHGMAPSSTGPKPDWYVQEYGLPRGVGEALRRDKLALWNQEEGTYTYTVRGKIYAQFHPWEHFLKIKPDSEDKLAQECRWSATGNLNDTQANEVNPETAANCNTLINQLAHELNIVVE